MTPARRATILSAVAPARSVFAVAVAGLLAVGLGGRAHADPDADAKARGAKLFEEGRAFAKQGDFTHACDRFDKSYALDPAPGTEMNLADCVEHLGKLRKAWHLFDAAAAELDRNLDTRAGYAHQRADKLLAQLATIVVHIARPLPAGLSLTINKHGEPATAEVRDVVEPGPIEVVATAPDKAAVTRTARGLAGGTVTLDLELVGDTAATAAPEHDHEPDGATHRRTSWVHAALGIGGAGAAVELAGLAFGLAARSGHQGVLDDGSCKQTAAGLTCTPDGADRETSAGQLADVATVLTLGGAALLVGGAIVYLAAPSDGERVHVAPIAGSHVVGLTLAGAF